MSDLTAAPSSRPEPPADISKTVMRILLNDAPTRYRFDEIVMHFPREERGQAEAAMTAMLELFTRALLPSEALVRSAVRTENLPPFAQELGALLLRIETLAYNVGEYPDRYSDLDSALVQLRDLLAAAPPAPEGQ